MVPTLKDEPELRLAVRLTDPQLSETDGVAQMAMAEHPELVLSVMLEGQPVITGGVVSISPAEQHNASPLLLVPSTTVKLPKVELE